MSPDKRRDEIVAGFRRNRSVPFLFEIGILSSDEIHKRIKDHAASLIDDYSACHGITIKGARKSRLLAHLERMRILAEALPQDESIDS